MHYTLDTAYLGKVAQCSSCREQFVLERISETLTLTPHSGKEPTLDETDQDRTPPHPEEAVEDRAPPLRRVLESAQEQTKLHPEPTDHLPVRRPPEPQNETLSITSDTSLSDDHAGIWNVGEVVLGIYEVKQLAPNVPYAQGGVGIVQKIYHREWDMELAVKSPKPGVLRSESGIASYERECQTWMELGLHPNIVTCYLVRRIGGVPRIFAEYIPDGSLRDWMVDLRLYEGGPKASLLRIVDIAIQFAWGLDYAHRQGLLHLDVKPANVMMSGSTPKVTDFGLAQVATTDSMSKGLAASKWEGMTPGFCSPEQYRAFELYQRGEVDTSLKITAQSDIWSWAISILSMFHGRAPCRKGGQTAAKVFEMFLTAPTPNDRPRMPPALVELMRHCFQEDPKDRPRSMSEIAARLIDIHAEASGAAYPRKAPSITQLTAESLNNQAVSFLDLHKKKEAEHLFQEALKMQPWEPEVTYNQTLHLWRDGGMTDLEAIERLETLVKIRNEPVSHFALGLAQRERGNLSPARQEFESAMELKARPDFKRALAGAEKIVERGIRCVDRFAVKHRRGPLAFLDDKEEILLIAIDERLFFVYDIKQHRRWLTLKVSQDQTNESSATGRRIALSEDFQWELSTGKNSSQPVLKSVADASKKFQFAAVPWGSLKLNATGTFRAATWESSYSQPAHAASASFELYSRDSEETRMDDSDWDSASDTTTKDAASPPGIWNFQVVGKDHQVGIVDGARKNVLGTLQGHEDEIHSISHGGRKGEWIVTGSRDRTIRIWELPICRCVRTISGLDSPVDAVYLARSGAFVIALLGGNSLRIWDVGILCRNSEHLRAPILLCQVSSSEELSRRQSELTELQEELTSAIDKDDYSTATEILRKLRDLPSWDSVRGELPWDILIQKCKRVKPTDAVCLHTLVGHEDKITAVALSLDGRLAVSTGKDQTIRLWNTQSGKCARILTGHQDWIRDVALTWDGRYLVSGSWDTTVRVWNVGTGKCVRTLNDRVRSISRVAIQPTGKITAIATAAGSLLLWDVAADHVVGNWTAHQGGINTMAFNRDGRYLVTGGDDATVCVWDTASLRLVRKWSRGKLPITAVRILIGNLGLISASKEGVLEIRRLPSAAPPTLLSGHVAEIAALATVVDNRFFVTASRDQTVKIWKQEDGSLLKTLSGHSGPITGLAMDFSGRKILTGSEDGTVRFWELFWELDYPGSTDWEETARPFLYALLSLYCEDAEPGPPKLDEPTIQRILLEMGYRGFGHIRPDAIRDEIQKMLTRWSGPQEFPKE